MLGMLAPVVVLWAVAAMGMLGASAARPFLRELALTPLEHFVCAVLAGALILGFAVWAVGYFRYDAATMAAILVAATMAGIPERRRVLEWLRALADTRVGGLWLVFPFAAALLIAIGLIGSYAPPSDHDTIRYHLLLPARDLAYGRIEAYFGWSIYEFLPPVGGMLNRLVFALAGATGLMMFNVAWQGVAGVVAASIAVRLGGGAGIGWLAAFLVLAQRVSINLSSVASTEFVLAAFAGGAVLAALILRAAPGRNAGIMLGLAAGGAAMVKHHGAVFVAGIFLILGVQALSDRRLRMPLLLAASLAAAVTMPWLVRNAAIAGNPLFPTLHSLFGADNVEIFGPFLATMRHPIDTLSTLRLPWDMFVNQLRFDGLQFGVPVFLILIPFVTLCSRRREAAIPLVAAAFYTAVWWATMPHLLRFHVVMLPALAAVAALAGGEIVRAAAQLTRPWRIASLGIAALLTMGQAGFLGATAVRRIPAAVGAVTPSAYLNDKAFAFYAQYSACNWAIERLAPGERILTALNDPTVFCPPWRAFPQFLPGDAAWIYTRRSPEAVSAAWLADAMRRCRIRYVVAAKNLGADSEPLAFAKHRFDGLLLPAFSRITPAFESEVGAVYDGMTVARALDEMQTQMPSVSKAAVDRAFCDYPKK